LKVLFALLFLPVYCFSFVVLIDPGHGGQELGAIGKHGKKHIYEKDISLQISKEIKRYINKQHTVYLTRSFDRDLSLQERAKMADTVKADIFVSVHFNSSIKERHNGFETFYLHNTKNKATKKVERIENKSLEGDDKLINNILIDLVIQKTTKQSKKLASSVHSQLNRTLPSKFKMQDRGLKKGLFYVLALAKRPAILLEGGFMSNKNDLKKIQQRNFIKEYSKAIAKGIEIYLATLTDKTVPIF
jgi:N-acetylmuramoyl-L-alanine amidase